MLTSTLISIGVLLFSLRATISNTLSGTVRHYQEVWPVPDQLKAGSVFGPESLDAPSINNWAPIPKWLAGTWQFEEETVTSVTGYNNVNYPKQPFTIQNKFTKHFGYQVDRNGQIWDYLRVPYDYTTSLEQGLKSLFVDSELTQVSMNEDMEVRRIFGLDSVYSPSRQVILVTQQKECINRTTPAGKNKIHIDCATTIFNLQGKPEVEKSSNMTGTRAEPFQPIDQDNGENLKKLFHEYLRAHGKSNLIPK